MKKSFIICILVAIMLSVCNEKEEGVQSQTSEVVMEENYYEDEERLNILKQGKYYIYQVVRM